MDMEKMVQTVTREVLKQILQREQQSKKLSKKILILDTEYESFLRGALEGHLFDELLLYDLNVYETNETIEPYDCILLPWLTIDELVNIATGVRSNPISKAVSDSLLYSKTVLIPEEGLIYKKFKDTCNRAYFQMLEDYRKRIEGFGVIICKKRDLANILMNPLHSVHTQENNTNLQNKKVITESDVQKVFFLGGQEVFINNKALITSLAQDYIKEKDIKLIRLEDTRHQ